MFILSVQILRIFSVFFAIFSLLQAEGGAVNNIHTQYPSPGMRMICNYICMT